MVVGSGLSSVRAAGDWPVDTVAVAAVSAGGELLGAHGPQDREFPLASVTKLLSAYAVLVAVEEGAVEWDEPAGPDDSTVRHLVAHASGLAFDSTVVQAQPGQRRIYSNTGFEALAEHLRAASGIAFADYLAEAVLAPLGMTATRLDGSPAHAAVSTCADLARFAAELLAPALTATLGHATSVAYPGLDGVLPGYGNQRPNDWGLGYEVRGDKHPHWTGTRSSPRTFGHFGRAGTFLWVDPDAGAACVALTDREFGPWAIEAWTPFTDGILDEVA